MTRLVKPVTRETAAMDRGRPLVATLHAHYLEIRPKGTRQRYRLGYEVALWVALRRQMEEQRKEKRKRHF